MNTSTLLTALLFPIGMCQAQQAHAADTRPPEASPSENAAQLKRDVSTSIGYAMGIIFSQKGRTPITMDVDIYMTSFQTAFKNGIKNAACKEAAEKVASITDADEKRTAQSISDGLNMAFSLFDNGFIPDDIDMNVYRQAFEAALQGKVDEEKVRTFDRSSKRMRQIISERNAAAAQSNLSVAQAFLKENARKPGIVATPSGLQYKIETTGTGPAYQSEKDGDSPAFTVKYTVHDINGTLLADHSQQPVLFMENNHTRGLIEALNKMNIGSIWTLYLPPNLAFGEQTLSPSFGCRIPGNSLLIVRIELCGIEPSFKKSITSPDGTRYTLTPLPLNEDDEEDSYLIQPHLFSF